MENKALKRLVRMELIAFVIFMLFVAGTYWTVEWLQWVSTVLFVLPVSGIMSYPKRSRECGERFDKARFAWAVISMGLYLGMGWLLVSLLGN